MLLKVTAMITTDQGGDRKRAMVIECIGLPGSGKTYLMELVGKELRRREVDYVNVSANLRNRISWKILRKIVRAAIYLSADARWLRDRLMKILGEEGELHSSFGVCENEKYAVRSAAVYSFVYRRMVRSPRIYLFDEGLVQALVKFCADFRISDGTFRKMVTASEQGVRSSRLVIFNETSMEDSLASVKDTDRRAGASGGPDGEKLTQILEEYVRLNEVYRNSFNVLEIRKEDDKRRKLSRVFGRIRQILSNT